MTGIPLTSSAKKSMLIAEYLLRCAKESTSDHAAVLCEYVESCLSHAKTYLKLHVVSTANDKSLLLDIGAMYYTLATIYKSIGNQDSANNCFKKAEKRKYVPGQHQVSSSLPGSQSLSRPQSQSQSQPQSQPQSQFTMSAATSPEVNPALGSTQRSDNTCIEKAFESNYQNVFPANISQDSQAIELPEFSQPFTSISQLIHCVTLIHDYHNPSGSSDKILTDKEHKWLQKISNYSEFQKKIQELPGLIITIFTNDNSKPPASVSEVVLLAPVLQKQRFRGLLCSFVEKVNSSKEIIQEYLLEGMAQLIQNSPDGYLDSNDLVQILNLLINLLQNVHGQDTKIVYQLVSTISRLLDAMADIKVHDVDRTLLCSLSACLEGLMHYNDSCVVYQAAYASQALLYVPDDVSPTQLVMQRAVKVFKGASTIVRAVKGFDIDGFIDGLADIQRGLPITEIYDLAKTAYEGYKSLKESGQDFYSAVKECISFDKQSAWYPALRGIDILVTTGQLAEFKELVNKASCQPQRLFLWGVTERLGRIAIESKWKLHVQCHAIDFLSEIYSNDQRWGQQADVKQWILQVLIQVKGTTDGEIRTHAIDTLTKLQELGNENKRNLYQDTIKEGSGLYSLECLLPHLNGFALLNQAQNKPQVEIDIEKVKWMRMSEYKQDIYITQRAKPSLQANNNNATDLMTKVQEFIKGRSEVFLILGDSGSGKSTFNQRLENELWNSYNPNEDFIPLFINLPSIDKPEYDMVSKRLQSLGFTDAQIRELRSSRKFILICDGYDELQRTGNLYISNNINRKDGWNAKMIISCRSEYVGDKYRSDFEPVYDRNDIEGSKSLEEAVIVPFLDFQVDSYIKEFVANDSSLWSFDTYQKAIQQNSDIKNLISNPFLLKVVVEALPRMISPDSKFEDIQVTRYSLYEQFVTRWIERNKKRAEEYSEALLKTAYKKLNQEGLGRNGMLFMTNLAVKIYKEQNGNPVVEYIRLEDKSTWKDEFFGWENEKQILIEVCPLISTGSQYRFFHKSILEYFVARSVCRSLTQTRGRGVECIRDQNEEGVDATQDDTAASNDLYVKGKSIVESIIGSINIVKEPSIVSFLSDCIEKEPFLKEELLEVIEQSKTDKSVQVAATNAITVLVRAGVPFHQKDLRGICIPGADLSQGKFDNAQLQGSDLSNTTMKNIWMRGANLSDSKMGGIYFGQRAYLEIGHDYGNGISSIRYSSDEKRVLFAGGKYSYCSSFGVFIFNTLTWEQEVEIEFRCDSQYFKDALFTYDNQQVIMILDNRICIWDTRTVKEVFSNSFKSEVLPCYCLSRHELAIVDDEENIIRIISITEDKCLHELKGHTGPINWLSYSPSGSIIVSCDKDKFICLWNTQTGEVIKTIVEDTGVLYKVVFSPTNSDIFILMIDRAPIMTLQIRSAESAECLRTLDFNSTERIFTDFSPDGRYIVLNDRSENIYLMNVESGGQNILKSGSVRSYSFSSNGSKMITCNYDETMKIWYVDSGKKMYEINGYRPMSAVFSPDSKWIIAAEAKRAYMLDSESRYDNHLGREIGHTSSVSGAYHHSKDNTHNTLCTVGVDDVMITWDEQSGSCIRKTNTGNLIPNTHITDFHIEPSTRTFRCWYENTLEVWNIERTKLIVKLEGMDNKLSVGWDNAFPPKLVSTYQNQTAVTLELDISVPDMDMFISEVAFSPDCRTLALYYGWAYEAKLWDTKTGAHIGTLSESIEQNDQHDNLSGPTEGNNDSEIIEQRKTIYSLSFSPQGNNINLTFGDSSLSILSSTTYEHCFKLKNVRTFLYTLDDSRLATFGDDKVTIWDTKNWNSTHEIDTSGSSTELYFSSSGDRLALVADDGWIQIWDLTVDQQLATLSGDIKAVKYLLFSTQDENYFVTGHEGGSVRRWEMRKTNEGYTVYLCWSSRHDNIAFFDAQVDRVKGLDDLTKKLLLQRGVIGKASPRFRDVAKKVVALNSTLSRISDINEHEPYA